MAKVICSVLGSVVLVIDLLACWPLAAQPPLVLDIDAPAPPPVLGTAAEIRSRVAPCAERLFAVADADGSGGLSLAELQKATTMVIQIAAGAPGNRVSVLMASLGSMLPSSD